MPSQNLVIENIPNISIAGFRDVLKYTPVDNAIALRGKHGIGKSQIVEQVGREEGYEVVTIFSGQIADPGDLVGLPQREKVTYIDPEGKPFEQTVTSFCPPDWWPRDATKKYLVFIDEANRNTSNGVIACLFDFILNRKLKGKSLSPQSRIVAAMNPDYNGYYSGLIEFDPALFSRFRWFNLTPTVMEWKEHAKSKGVHPAVLKFIDTHPEHLDPYNDATLNIKTIPKVVPSRRSWFQLSKALKDGLQNLYLSNKSFFQVLVGGYIGTQLAITFTEEYSMVNQGNIADLISGYSKGMFENYHKNEKVNLKSRIIGYLKSQGENLTQLEADNIEHILSDLGKEIALSFVQSLKDDNASGEVWGRTLLSLNKGVFNSIK